MQKAQGIHHIALGIMMAVLLTAATASATNGHVAASVTLLLSEASSFPLPTATPTPTSTPTPTATPTATATPTSTPVPAPTGMVYIAGGTFQMGDALGDGSSDELPLHPVTLAPFFMGRCEVSKSEWDSVYTWAVIRGYEFTQAGAGKSSNHPVQSVSWYDMVKWCNAKSEKEALTPCYTVTGGVYKAGQSEPDCDWSANGYRLPTEAEWEYAARGGVAGARFPWGDRIDQTLANYNCRCSGGEPADDYDDGPVCGYHPAYATGGLPYTSPGGAFPANNWDVCDLAGNVWEWCWDWYDGSYYGLSPSDNPRGPVAGTYRVMRGGGYDYYASNARVSHRNYYAGVAHDSLGFRLVRRATN